MRPPFVVASIAYICYTMPGQLSTPKTRSSSRPARRPLHALEPLVESGVRITLRLRPHSDLPVDVPLPGGNDRPQGSPGGHQHRARPGPGAGLLRPPPGFLPQLRPGSRQAHLRLVRTGLPPRPGILRVNGRPVLVGDGIKVAKAGRKMPAVKKLHQQCESNNKAEYIFGHSCQAVAVLTQALSSVFALPLACRIHEGTVFSNRDHRTLLDKMILLLDSLDIKEPCYFVADAYYAAGNIVRGLLAHGNHLVTRVRSNSVAFFPAMPPPSHQPRGRGRPAKYGKKIKVAALLKQTAQLQEAPSPVYGEKGVILRFRAADLL